jgi:hypothetical protein
MREEADAGPRRDETLALHGRDRLTMVTRASSVVTSRAYEAQRTVVRSAEGGFGDAFVFLVPLLLPFEASVGGQLFAPELVLLIALPFLLDAARRRGVSRIADSAVILGVLWLFGLVFTDIYRGTSFHDYSRGWANVVFLLIDFAGLALLIDERWRRVMLFAGGLAAGEVLQFYFNPDALAIGNPWKFGYGAAVTLAGVLLAARPNVYRRRVVATGILIALGVINLKMGFRSLGGISFLSAFMVMVAARSAHVMRFDRSLMRTVAILGASVLIGFGVVSAYGYGARHGLLGSHSQEKYLKQQGHLGIVVGGRPVVIAEALAIRDSPIIGHGSWAKDPRYAAALQNVLFHAGYVGNYSQPPSSPLIPTGSYLFGAWVFAGFLGGAFWLWATVLASSVMLRLHRLADGRVALVAFLGFSFLWAVLFSPLGAESRLTAAFSLVVFLLARNDIVAKYGESDVAAETPAV